MLFWVWLQFLEFSLCKEFLPNCTVRILVVFQCLWFHLIAVTRALKTKKEKKRLHTLTSAPWYLSQQCILTIAIVVHLPWAPGNNHSWLQRETSYARASDLRILSFCEESEFMQRGFMPNGCKAIFPSNGKGSTSQRWFHLFSSDPDTAM